MDLELLPIDGKEDLSQEEKRKLKKRSQRIHPILLKQFTENDEIEIKKFLIELVILGDEFHHETEEREFEEGHEERLTELSDHRFELFQNLSNPLGRFVKLLSLAPAESSEEIEILVKEMRSEELRGHYKTTQETGIEAASDNPFLMQMDDDIEGEHRALEMQCRATPCEIATMINHFSLEEIVEYLITARKMTSGDFWSDDYYDL